MDIASVIGWVVASVPVVPGTGSGATAGLDFPPLPIGQGAVRTFFPPVNLPGLGASSETGSSSAKGRPVRAAPTQRGRGGHAAGAWRSGS